MPYIGKEPVAGNFVLLDSITTSATATYALTKDSVAYSPESARNMIVSLNGVTQAPEAAFTVSGSNITFSSALTASDVIDYILVLGDVLSVGTPSDGTVGTSQMSYPLGNFSSTGIDDNATSTAITIDGSENVGIGTTTPVSLGAGYKNLDIRHTTGGGVTLGDTSNIHAYLFSDNNGVTLQSPGSRSIKFTTVSTERMRIDSSGNVGIGTTNPLQLLHITKASADNYIRLGSNGANDAGIYFNTGTDWTIGTDTSNSNAFDLSNSSTVGGASKLVVTTGGNVGIGTTSPGSYNALGSSKNFVVSSGGTTTMTIHSGTTNYGHLAFADGTAVANDQYRGLIQYFHTDNSMRLYTNAAERMRILSSGGITFNGDTASANALDDYEEGTWEPALIGTSSNPSVTYHSDTGGFYIKVGRLVYVTGTIRTTAYSGGSGNLLIASIPFGNSARTNGDNADGVGTAYTNIWNGTSGEHPTFVRSKQNDSAFFIGQNSHDAVATLLDVGDWGSTCMMSFTLVYHTN